MEHPSSYLIIYNVAKKHNVGTLIRSAAAFGVSELWVVGSRKVMKYGHQGTAKRLIQRNLKSLNQLKQYANTRGVLICGVEIDPRSRSVWQNCFTASTAFLLGNQGHGLSEAQVAICDFLVFIPQYSSNTESLNVSVAGAIILSHFASKLQSGQIGFEQTPFEGNKFPLTDPTGQIAHQQTAEEIRQQRQNRNDSPELDLEGIF